MSWTEFISHMLATTHKIEKIAVLNYDGQPLAVTEELSVSDLEGKALIKSLLDPARTITKMHIDNNFYTLYQGNDNTVIGMSPEKDRVFVAHKSENHVVVAFGKTTGHHGSFLFELKKNLLLKQKNKLHGDQRIIGQHEIHRLSQQEIQRLSQLEIESLSQQEMQRLRQQEIQRLSEQDASIQELSEQEILSDIDKTSDLLDSIMLSVDLHNSHESEQQTSDEHIHMSDSQVLLQVK